MVAGARRSTALPIVTIGIRNEPDLVLVRQRARVVAELLGFGAVDQTRIATAASEIARNALRYAGGGRARLMVAGAPQGFEIAIEDAGPGILPLDKEPEREGRLRAGGVGITLARRLMDDFEVTSVPDRGTTVRLWKRLPVDAAPLGRSEVAAVVDELLRRPPESLLDELQQQHQELLAVLENLTAQQETLRTANAELEETNRGVMALYADVARELDETNRGVMALYAQLDDQAAELRRVSALKDRFLSHLSHEFRTPLNATIALSRLLLDRVDGPLTGEQETQVRFIQGGADELLGMVDDLLDLAKIEAGRMERRIEPVEPGELLGALRGMLRPLAAAADLELRIEDPPPDAPTLRTDRSKVSQILRNLLSNAIKYTERGEVRLTTAVEGESVVFAVSDTGVGIPAGELDRMFEDFVRGADEGRRRASGTGLGLPLSRQLAQLLGGSIEAESREGVGSTFRLRLPVRTEETAAAEPVPGAAVYDRTRATEPVVATPAKPRPQPADAGGEGPRVVVIDDDPSSRYLVAHMLMPSGCVVVQAATAREGLEEVRRSSPAAIFLDLGLPDRSGFDLLTELKEDGAIADVPIIIYTSRELGEGETRELAGLALRVVRKSDPALATSIAGIGEALVRSVSRFGTEDSP